MTAAVPFTIGGKVVRVECDAEPSHPAVYMAAGELPPGFRCPFCERTQLVPSLAQQLDWYLAIRGHTLSTAHLTGAEQLVAEARYVLGEAGELRDAVAVYWHAALEAKVDEGHRSDVRAEIADVVLSATALAGFLGVSVEECIAEKTEADRGRG